MFVGLGDCLDSASFVSGCFMSPGRPGALAGEDHLWSLPIEGSSQKQRSFISVALAAGNLLGCLHSVVSSVEQ